ncbi:MAG: hypothetical protein JO149_09975 [Gammaproteobacteria bacterium]|nr:hypothetical protein [Gammaproteobacteria bacterium]
MDELEKLEAALENIPSNKVTAKLKKLMPIIDRRIHEGISHQEIIETLRANGLDINPYTFRTTLYAYRKSLQKNSSKQTKADNKMVVENIRPDKEPTTSSLTTNDMLDPKKRDALGEIYLNRKPSIFKRKVTNEDSSD